MYYEKAQFKRRVKRNKVKLKNGATTESITEAINITGLSKNSQFKDNETIAIIKTNDLNKILELENQLKEKDKTIKQLEKELNQDMNTVKAGVIEHYQKILFDLIQQINNRNKEVIKASETINNNILAIIKAVSIEYDKAINETANLNNDRVKELLNKLEANYNIELENTNKELVNNYLEQLETINKNNDLIANDIEQQIIAANKQIHNTSLFKLLLNKNKINFNIPTDKIKEPVKPVNNIVNSNIVKVSNYDTFNIIDKLLIMPNVGVDPLAIKEKFNINLEDLLINLDLEILPSNNNFIDVENVEDK